mgnify:CR=1 FL=1
MSAKLIEEAARAYCAACDAALPNPGDAREAPVREGIAAVVALVVERATEVIKREPDNYTVQNCCLSYGGDSFSGPMKQALECHRDILVREILRTFAAGTEG